MYVFKDKWKWGGYLLFYRLLGRGMGFEVVERSFKFGCFRS